MSRSNGYRNDERRKKDYYTEEELDQKLRDANQKMEDSSFRCVRTLHETMGMATATTEELERQSESLDRTEDNLDRMEVDLESSRRNMREVKSVFGSLVNRFTKPKIGSNAEPLPKPKKKTPVDLPPDKPPSSTQAQTQKKSTGNETVDRNLDEVELCLKQLEGQAYLIGHQLDESNDQLERIRVKMDRNDIKIKSVTRDAKRQL